MKGSNYFFTASVLFIAIAVLDSCYQDHESAFSHIIFASIFLMAAIYYKAKEQYGKEQK